MLLSKTRARGAVKTMVRAPAAQQPWGRVSRLSWPFLHTASQPDLGFLHLLFILIQTGFGRGFAQNLSKLLRTAIEMAPITGGAMHSRNRCCCCRAIICFKMRAPKDLAHSRKETLATNLTLALSLSTDTGPLEENTTSALLDFKIRIYVCTLKDVPIYAVLSLSLCLCLCLSLSLSCICSALTFSCLLFLSCLFSLYIYTYIHISSARHFSVSLSLSLLLFVSLFSPFLCLSQGSFSLSLSPALSLFLCLLALPVYLSIYLSIYIYIYISLSLSLSLSVSLLRLSLCKIMHLFA